MMASYAAQAALIFIGSLALGALLVRAILPLLRRTALLDVPNERSSHTAPTPRGGGIAVVPVVIGVLAVAATAYPVAAATLLALALGGAGLAVLGYLDDRHGLPPLPRFLVQLAAVALGLYALGGGVFQGLLPVWPDLLLTGFIWLWAVNAVNFMDGIDGITATELGTVGAGLALIALLAGSALLLPLGLAGAGLAGAMAGFAIFNWSPAKLFLGDVGSVPLGYMTAGLLFALAAQGLWASALILPLYYACDATITLFRRLRRGETLWEAHRSHFYQRAVQGSWSHASTCRWILAVNLILVALAVPVEQPSASLRLAAAAATVGALLFLMTRAARTE